MASQSAYLMSVAGNYEYLELITNSKSGSFFFFSHDQRYIIKAMKVRTHQKHVDEQSDRACTVEVVFPRLSRGCFHRVTDDAWSMTQAWIRRMPNAKYNAAYMGGDDAVMVGS